MNFKVLDQLWQEKLYLCGFYMGNENYRKNMIARIFHRRTKAEDYEEYSNLMKSIAIPDYKNTKGFVDLTFLRRMENDIAHFTLITFWENLEVIKKFAGEVFEKAKYYVEDEKFLLEFEEKVIHNEVIAR